MKDMKRYMYSNVHSSTIYNGQDIEATETSFDRRMDKEVQGKRNPGKKAGTERGDQGADRLKLQSWTTSQSDHTDHSLV